MPTKLSKLFSSGSRVEILEALYYASNGLGLRQIAELCNLHVHSAEVALKQLHTEKLVKRAKQKQRLFYSLNTQNDNYELLKSIFITTETRKISARSALHTNEAKQLMNFIGASQSMIKKARNSYHGNSRAIKKNN
ncbi:MAG: hypothetical protein IT292_08085 [Deltaproteobacteria bacterium]|nr:hypothetical protein [Deltaproteobacteria bacterium]